MSRLRHQIAALDRAQAAARNPEASAMAELARFERLHRQHVLPPAQATIGWARQQLAEAREHLKRATSLLARRQAAEKGWLALVTAGRAMLRAASHPEWAKTTGVPKRVADWEKGKFKRAEVGHALRTYQRLLHGACFYGGVEEACDPAGIEADLHGIAQAIEHAAAVCKSQPPHPR